MAHTRLSSSRDDFHSLKIGALCAMKGVYMSDLVSEAISEVADSLD